METTQDVKAIPRECALQICADIRKRYQGKWWTAAGLQCWGCVTFSKGDPDRMCFSSRPDFRGCSLVTACYDRQQGCECEDA